MKVFKLHVGSYSHIKYRYSLVLTILYVRLVKIINFHIVLFVLLVYYLPMNFFFIIILLYCIVLLLIFSKR